MSKIPNNDSESSIQTTTKELPELTTLFSNLNKKQLKILNKIDNLDKIIYLINQYQSVKLNDNNTAESLNQSDLIKSFLNLPEENLEFLLSIKQLEQIIEFLNQHTLTKSLLELSEDKLKILSDSDNFYSQIKNLNQEQIKFFLH